MFPWPDNGHISELAPKPIFFNFYSSGLVLVQCSHGHIAEPAQRNIFSGFPWILWYEYNVPMDILQNWFTNMFSRTFPVSVLVWCMYNDPMAILQNRSRKILFRKCPLLMRHVCNVPMGILQTWPPNIFSRKCPILVWYVCNVPMGILHSGESHRRRANLIAVSFTPAEHDL